MKTFEEQISWLQTKQDNLEKFVEVEEDEKVKEAVAEDIQMLNSIIFNYKKARKDSVDLSWERYPEGMGR